MLQGTLVSNISQICLLRKLYNQIFKETLPLLIRTERKKRKKGGTGNKKETRKRKKKRSNRSFC